MKQRDQLRIRFWTERLTIVAPGKSIETSTLSIGVGYRMMSDFYAGNAAQAGFLAACELTGFYSTGCCR